MARWINDGTASGTAADKVPNSHLRLKHSMQLVKTEMCKFYLRNRCGKGEDCSFAHCLSEIREKPDLSFTSMCKTFLRTGNCSNPTCAYAHDERQLRNTSGFFKTKMCRFAASGRCKHGFSCRFAHCESELTNVSLSEGDGGLNTVVIIDQQPPPPPPQQSQKIPGRQGQHASKAEGSSSNSTTDDTGSTGSPPRTDVPSDYTSSARSEFDLSQSTFQQKERPDRRSQNNADNGQDTNFLAGRQCTTVMLTNVPEFLTQGALVSLLEDRTECMRGAFDFFYCPWDPYEDRNLGYAIINFFTRQGASKFEALRSGRPLLPKTRGSKKLRIVPAALQGRAANLRHFSGFSLAHHEDPRFRPLVRPSPSEPLRPMAIPEARSNDSKLRKGSPHDQQLEQQGEKLEQLQEQLRILKEQQHMLQETQYNQQQMLQPQPMLVGPQLRIVATQLQEQINMLQRPTPAGWNMMDMGAMPAFLVQPQPGDPSLSETWACDADKRT